MQVTNCFSLASVGLQEEGVGNALLSQGSLSSVLINTHGRISGWEGVLVVGLHYATAP